MLSILSISKWMDDQPLIIASIRWSSQRIAGHGDLRHVVSGWSEVVV